ncbi:MAG: hypothetical protein QM270_06860 [Bacillota bacterium]|nr:hypothetical protein [Bacillota bacterium]
MRLQELDNLSETTTENGWKRTRAGSGGTCQKDGWQGKSSLRTSGGQNEELSKKRFGLLVVLTTKGLVLVKTRSYPKNHLDYSLS